MRSIQAEAICFALKYMNKPFQAPVPINPVTMKRINSYVKLVTAPLKKVPSFVTLEKISAGGTSAEWVIADGQKGSENVLLYIHGGGYFFGAPATHRPITWRLSRDAKLKVLSLKYRMIPENKLEDCWEDTLNAYRWLLSEGYKPENIIVGGDSAGGALTLQLLFQLREMKLPMPVAAFLISPFADMTFKSESTWKNAKKDHLFHASLVKRLTIYLGQKYGKKNPFVSPVFGSYENLPPLLIQVADSEIIRDDSLLIKEKAERAGCEVHYKEWDNLPHVFTIFSNIIPEAKAGVEEIAAFINDKLKTK